jgi:hypothetical protein
MMINENLFKNENQLEYSGAASSFGNLNSTISN